MQEHTLLHPHPLPVVAPRPLAPSPLGYIPDCFPPNKEIHHHSACHHTDHFTNADRFTH